MSNHRITYQTHPEYWDGSPEWTVTCHERIIQERVEFLLNCKEQYYIDPTNPMNISNKRYDYLEWCLERDHPDHPFLDMVGWDDIYRETCKNWHVPGFKGDEDDE